MTKELKKTPKNQTVDTESCVLFAFGEKFFPGTFFHLFTELLTRNSFDFLLIPLISAAQHRSSATLVGHVLPPWNVSEVTQEQICGSTVLV